MIKKFMVGLGLVAMAGCSQTHEALNTAKDQVMNPPEAVLEALKALATFVVELLAQFTSHVLGGPAFQAIVDFLKMLGL